MAGASSCPAGWQRWRGDAIARLLDTEDADVLFIAGCEDNQVRFHCRFDLIILLSAPAPAMIERLGARTGNPYGKAPGDMDRILGGLAAVEPLLRKAADHEIRTTIPLAEVVAKVLYLAGLTPDGHDRPKMRSGCLPAMTAEEDGDFANSRRSAWPVALSLLAIEVCRSGHSGAGAVPGWGSGFRRGRFCSTAGE